MNRTRSTLLLLWSLCFLLTPNHAEVMSVPGSFQVTNATLSGPSQIVNGETESFAVTIDGSSTLAAQLTGSWTANVTNHAPGKYLDRGDLDDLNTTYGMDSWDFHYEFPLEISCVDGKLVVPGMTPDDDQRSLNRLILFLTMRVKDWLPSANLPSATLPEPQAFQTNEVSVKCVGHGGTGGEPHFKTWTGVKYDYHGECDMVLLQNPRFGTGAGLDVHIRTELREYFSFISNVAVRIGNDILEMTNQGQVYINGQREQERTPQSQKPLLLAGGNYSVVYMEPQPHKHTYKIDLGNSQSLIIRSFKDFMYVSFLGALPEDFEDSVGLMGSFHSGRMLGRNGREYQLHEVNRFGQEWQVRRGEPRLFLHQDRDPQLPREMCRLPSVAAVEQRRRALRSRENGSVLLHQAEAACESWGKDKDSCIYDIMATGDLELADAGAF